MTALTKSSAEIKAAHLLDQARQKLGLTQDQIATAVGVPRSTFARRLSVHGSIPKRWLPHAIDWLARSLGLEARQVEQYVHSRSAGPIALLELNSTRYYQFEEHTPRQIAATLIHRLENATVTIFSPVIPPSFLLTKQVRDVLGENSNSIQDDSTCLEQARQMHTTIARHIWLYPEQLPARWELIVPERTIAAMSNIDGPFSGVTFEAMTELTEIWHHDFAGERKLAIRVLPECPEASSIIRHFAEARTVIFINRDYRWKEICDSRQVQVTSVNGQGAGDALRWDLDIIDLARRICDDEPPSRRVAPMLGNLRDYRQVAIELRTHQPRLAA
ncbi:MAG TPA: helix-turn-helix transcriptional regulator [Tepidisphaeraceae bacterium]|jgi:transcriptional regulator with XRE-family HTH domain|nr:helix-turn-helix transcriptional regulator [Tepidisphaeraceae bacterium]